MANDKKTVCSYCDSQHTQLDYALHRVSNAHVKKVQRNLVHRGFISACLVCNFTLKNLKQVELHIQEKSHMDRMKSFLVDSYLSGDKCTCGSCGITFFNEVALEAHCLSSSHDLTSCSKLDELSRLLSGLYGKQFMSTCNRLCSICDVTFDCIEDSIMHLFTAAHISRLRSSFCMVCKKEFTHASDRELHINSSKHHVAMRKCHNLLQEVHTQGLLSKGGHPCMLCMIWCNSWFCLELHILDKNHAKALVQSKAKCPILARIVFSAVLEGIGQSACCNESTRSSWREWRVDTSKERIWCHKCGILLLSIDDVNEHLKKHSTDRCSTTSRSHSSSGFDLASVSEIHECCICALSFKNAFMLNVHEASFEHHRRLAACLISNDVKCCSNCGLLFDNDGDGDDAIAVTKRAEVGSKCPDLQRHGSSYNDLQKKASNIKVLETIMQATSSAEGTHQVSVVADKVFTEAISHLDTSDSLLNVRVNPGSGELPVSPSDKTARDGEGVDRVSIETTLSNSFAANENVVGSNKAHSRGTNCSLSEVSLPNVVANAPECHSHSQLACASPDDTILHRNPILLAGQISDGNGGELPKEANFAATMVPIVVAASFAPLGMLRESLQSITAIVSESLSSALPTFYMRQSMPSLKRKSQAGVEEVTGDQQDVKRMCPERILEAALRQGLQSVCSNTTRLKDLDVECQGLADHEMVRLRIGNDEDVKEPQAVVAVAASIIPNGLRDSFIPAGVKVQVEVNKAQGSSAMQSGDDSNRKGQESTEVKSESLSEVVVGDQGSAGSIKGKAVVKEKPTHMQPSTALFCTGTQKDIASTPVSLTNGAINSMKNGMKNGSSLPAKKLDTTMGVAKSGVPKESKSNDDDDYYAFLDPTKGRPEWWSSSDSEDSDTVCK